MASATAPRKIFVVIIVVPFERSIVSVKGYLASLPERVVRSAVGLGAGVVREVGDVVIPESIRRGQLYQNLVDTTLRFLIEQVGGAEGVYKTDEKLGEDFLVRRTAGNVLEVAGVVAFRASPVWVLAALSDLCGMGRHLIPEISEALKAEGLLDKDTEFSNVDQILDGLEKTSSRLASTVNTPPLDVASLRREWAALRDDARSLTPSSLPSRESIAQLWTQLKTESAQQNRSVFEMSSMLAVSAASKLPDGVRWLSASAKSAASRTGHVFGSALLEYYSKTLADIREIGFIRFTGRQMRPYMQAAVVQFSPTRPSLTQRLIDRWKNRRGVARQ
jgi:hypothetical protein